MTQTSAQTSNVIVTVTYSRDNNLEALQKYHQSCEVFRCISCRATYSMEEVSETLKADADGYAVAECPHCDEKMASMDHGENCSEDAGQEWSDWCTAKIADAPAGVSCEFCHEQEGAGDFWIEFAVETGTDLEKVAEYFRGFGGSLSVSSKKFQDSEINQHSLSILLSPDVDKYNAPATLDRYERQDAGELRAILAEIEAADGNGGVSTAADQEDCCAAIAHVESGIPVVAGQDDDGWFFLRIAANG